MNHDGNDTARCAQSIAFVHHKGGTGKTTSCLNIAGCLAKMNQRVLVVDLDPQGNATGGLGIDRRTLGASVYDVLFGKMGMGDVILETASGVHLAPASVSLLSAEMHIAELRDHTSLLEASLAPMQGYYDYILIDVPPASTILMVNGIVAADGLIVPIDTGIFGIETMETLWILLDRIAQELGVQPQILCTLLRAYPARLFGKDPTKEFQGRLERFLSTHELPGTKIHVIPYSHLVYTAQVRGMPLSHFKPHCDVGRAFKKVSSEIVHNGVNAQREQEAVHG